MARTPALAVTVILTFGLGIGANAAMFGIIDRLMFRPFPYVRNPGSVNRVYLQSASRDGRRTDGVNVYTRYLDLARGTSSFSQAAGFANSLVAVGTGESARKRRGGFVVLPPVLTAGGGDGAVRGGRDAAGARERRTLGGVIGRSSDPLSDPAR